MEHIDQEENNHVAAYRNQFAMLRHMVKEEEGTVISSMASLISEKQPLLPLVRDRILKELELLYQIMIM